VDWNHLTRDRDQWLAVVNRVMNLREPIKCGEFLDWLNDCQLLKKVSAP
jgi:hypothetical protein